MEYKRFKNIIAVKMIIGDEVIGCLEKLAKIEKIHFAKIEGIGRIKNPTVAYFKDKKFHKKTFQGEYEMPSILGNISGDQSVHTHISFSRDEDQHTYGGHLFSSEIGYDVELMVTIISDDYIDKYKGNNEDAATWKFKNYKKI